MSSSSRELRAGALRTTLVDGRLGGVVLDGHEVWHGIHFLLRDSDCAATIYRGHNLENWNDNSRWGRIDSTCTRSLRALTA